MTNWGEREKGNLRILKLIEINEREIDFITLLYCEFLVRRRLRKLRKWKFRNSWIERHLRGHKRGLRYNFSAHSLLACRGYISSPPSPPWCHISHADTRDVLETTRSCRWYLKFLQSSPHVEQFEQDKNYLYPQWMDGRYCWCSMCFHRFPVCVYTTIIIRCNERERESSYELNI